MIKRIPRLGVIGGVAVHVIATKACRGLSAFQSRHHQCSVFREALLNSAYLFFSFLPLTQSWSSPLQETSSMLWRHPALTSCWEGKAGTLLWAHSQSTQRRAPLFLESRPRGGDWSGLCFDTRFFFSLVFVPQRQILLIAPTWPRGGRALTNSECGLLCAKTKLDICLLFRAPATLALPKNTKTKSSSFYFYQRLQSRFCQTFQTSSRPAAFARAVCCSFSLQTVCISTSHLNRRATEAFNWLLLVLALESQSGSTWCIFSFFHPDSMNKMF